MSVIDEVIKKAKKDAGFTLQLTAMVDMFTIMIVFLLKSYDTSALKVQNVDDLRLPSSITADMPEEALLLLVSGKGIYINDTQVAKINDGVIDPESLSPNDEDYIKNLFSELNEEAKRIEEQAKINPDVKFEGKLFMQADKDLPYSVLRKIMYTATMAGYGDLRLATMDGGS